MLRGNTAFALRLPDSPAALAARLAWPLSYMNKDVMERSVQETSRCRIGDASHFQHQLAPASLHSLLCHFLEKDVQSPVQGDCKGHTLRMELAQRERATDSLPSDTRAACFTSCSDDECINLMVRAANPPLVASSMKGQLMRNPVVDRTRKGTGFRDVDLTAICALEPGSPSSKETHSFKGQKPCRSASEEHCSCTCHLSFTPECMLALR